MKKAVIISGGGALGACGAGTLAALDHNYKIVAGISTGALMSPFVSLNEWDILKEAYTSVTDKDIFDTTWYKPSPFTKDGKLNKLALVYALIIGSKTVATSKSMRKLIDKFLTEKDFKRINDSGKELIVAAQNLNELPSRLHYFSSANFKLEDFKDWMWCSANAPFFTSLVQKEWIDVDGKRYIGEWTDGGLSELLILQDNLLNFVDEVDIIIHRVKPQSIKQRGFIKDLVHNIERSVDAMRFDIEFEDGELCNKLQKISNEKQIKINVYWLPFKLTNNSLQFDKKEMLKWWEIGFATAFDEERIDRIIPVGMNNNYKQTNNEEKHVNSIIDISNSSTS
jgi:NTE family protein